MDELIAKALENVDPDKAVNGASCPFCGASIGDPCSGGETDEARLVAFIVLTGAAHA